jgi:hypothetical protein
MTRRVFLNHYSARITPARVMPACRGVIKCEDELSDATKPTGTCGDA